MTGKAIAIIQKFIFVFISSFFFPIHSIFFFFTFADCVNMGIIETYCSVDVSAPCGDEGET